MPTQCSVAANRNGSERWAVFETGMLVRLVGALLMMAALAAGQATVPLADFHGKVHGVSKKQITIETAEGNLVDFEINKKTRILRRKVQISPSDVQTGDIVTIEARQEMLRFLIAVVITVEPKPKD